MGLIEDHDIRREVLLGERKPINLYFNYYRDKNPDRDIELQVCLEENLRNPYITRVYLIASSEEPLPNHSKIIGIPLDVRPTYNTFFSIVNENTGRDEINIISNSDIHFDMSLDTLSRMDLTNICLALGRWDQIDGEIKIFERYDAQDVWVFSGRIRSIGGEFCLGKPGCDNRIAHEIAEAGYEVINPSRSIKCIHRHESGVRNYKQAEVIPGPYKMVYPELLVVKEEA